MFEPPYSVLFRNKVILVFRSPLVFLVSYYLREGNRNKSIYLFSIRPSFLHPIRLLLRNALCICVITFVSYQYKYIKYIIINIVFPFLRFSTHVVLKMNSVPYWSKMGVLFAKMMHSNSTKLNPDEFFAVVKPPFFTRDHQHDSSEFLGYVLFIYLSANTLVCSLLEILSNEPYVNFIISNIMILSTIIRNELKGWSII